MNKNFVYVIGIDQSYKRTGISICYNNKIIACTSFVPEQNSQFEKRKYLDDRIFNWINKVSQRDGFEPQMTSDNTIIVFEKIRQFSQGFISMNYIIGTGALIAKLSDHFKDLNYEVFCVDTRAWKAAVVGTSKPEKNNYEIDEKKWPTIKYVKSLKDVDNKLILIEENKKKKGTIQIKDKFYSVNDDLCDAICISKYPFMMKNNLMKRFDF